MRLHFSTFLGAVAVGVLGLQLGWAQLTTATLYGIVNDSSGAVVPGAAVTLVHEATSARTTKLTGETGEFQVDFLRVGSYTLTIEAPGFKKYESKGIELTAGQTARQTYVLELGQVTETVRVEGGATLVDTVTAEQRESFSRQAVIELPLARRNYSSLLGVGTGVTYTTDSGNGIRLNGAGKNGASITVDGTDATSNPEARMTSMYQSFNYIDTVSIEAIQELQTTKGVIAAEFGQSLAGNVNLITKSGTNELHGTVFENFQAENLNARDQFLQIKPPLTFNQFGGSLGGPIRRDRIFIFGTYEGYRERAFRQVDGNTPTQKLRNEMIAAVPAYGKVLGTLPLPNQPHFPDADVGFYLSAASSKARENHLVVKGDIRVTASGSLSLTYTRGRPFRLVPTFRVGNDRDWTGIQERGTLSFVMAGASWSSETRFGYNLNDVSRLDAFWNVVDPAFPETTFGGRRLPLIDALGFQTADTELFQMGGPVWTLEQKYARHLGQHSLKFGGKYSRRGGGRFDIENVYARYANKADLLADIPSRLQATLGVNPFTSRSYEWGFFAQDDWRIRPNLVINLGVRYDYFSRYVAKPSTDAPAGLFNLDGLLDDRFNFGPFRDPLKPFEDDGWANIGPRVGFSYNPDRKSSTVIRGGFSVMFSPLVWSEVVRAVGISKNLPRRVIFGKSEAAELRLRFPYFNDDVAPLVETQSITQGKIQRSNIYKPDWQTPYTMQLYLGMQRALSSSLVFETAFVGNRGVKLMMLRDFNPVNRVTGVRPNPKLGEGQYTDDSQPTVYYSWQSSLRKRYSRNLTGSLHYTWGRALAYTGGDIGAGANGDTVGTIQEFFNWRAERSPAAGDTTHYFASEWVYDLPRFSSLSSAAARHLLGGWQASGIFIAATGQALLLTQPSAIAASRPDYIGGVAVNSNYRQTLQYLNPAAFRRVPVSSVSGATLRAGNVGYGAVRGPGRWNVDFSLAKNFSVSEQIQLQVRGDMFNFFNRTNFTRVETRIDRGNFGRLLGTAGARVVQLNARLSW